MPNLNTQQSGMVLIESLISILIFSMGILALAGLQAASISNASSAKYRSEASYLADQMTSGMWAGGNLASLATYACSPCTNATNGNAVTQQWAARAQATLPGVGGAANWPTIAFSVGNPNQVTVTVFWQAPNDTAMHNHVMVAEICAGALCT